MDFSKYIGFSVGPQKIEYNWRDVALYALAVGAHEDDLMYTYERNMKTLPSFGVVPYWNAVNNYPQRPAPYPASVALMNAMGREYGHRVNALHMEHELILHRPIAPIKGSLVFSDEIVGIYDRGEGKGIVAQTKVPVYDEAGNLICENISSTVFFEGGGFGGEKPPKSPVVIPEREPDFVVEDQMSEVQNVLYRLTGDTNHVHVNPDTAKLVGQPKPFMQGLCSFGFACRMGIKAIIPGEPERMTRIAAQMRSICFPGWKVKFWGWKNGDNQVVFQLVTEDGKPILDKGVIEYR